MLSGESFPPTSSQTFSPAIGHGVLARWSVCTLRLPVIGHLPDGRVFFWRTGALGAFLRESLSDQPQNQFRSRAYTQPCVDMFQVGAGCAEGYARSCCYGSTGEALSVPSRQFQLSWCQHRRRWLSAFLKPHKGLRRLFVGGEPQTHMEAAVISVWSCHGDDLFVND